MARSDNNQNRSNRGEDRASASRGPAEVATRNPLDVAAPEVPVDEAMLFEATEAVIRAISQQDPRLDESAAVSAAMESNVLAPFDLSAVKQALEFLRRLGYLRAS